MDFAGIGTFKFYPPVSSDLSDNPVIESNKKIIRDNYDEPEVLIFEDDIVFTKPDSFSTFLEIKETLPDNWDVFLGSYYHTDKKESVSKDLDLVQWEFDRPHHYVIRKKFYDEFLGMKDGKDFGCALKNSGAAVYAPKFLLSRPVLPEEWAFEERMNKKLNSTCVYSKHKHW